MTEATDFTSFSRSPAMENHSQHPCVNYQSATKEVRAGLYPSFENSKIRQTHTHTHTSRQEQKVMQNLQRQSNILTQYQYITTRVWFTHTALRTVLPYMYLYHTRVATDITDMYHNSKKEITRWMNSLALFFFFFKLHIAALGRGS